MGEYLLGRGREEGLVRRRPAGERVSRLCKWGLARSSPQGPTERGCAIQTADRRQGGESITRWRFAMGEVEGGPLKNRGGYEVALKEGGGVRVLRLGLLFRRGPTEVGLKEWISMERTQRAREEGVVEAGELRGELTRNYNSV